MSVQDSQRMAKGKRDDGLRCPECGSGLSYTVDSRPSTILEHFVTRRRKRCRPCGARWTTYEISTDDLRDILDLTTEDLMPSEEIAAAQGEVSITTGHRRDG